LSAYATKNYVDDEISKIELKALYLDTKEELDRLKSEK
jgi:hypothetical protein